MLLSIYVGFLYIFQRNLGAFSIKGFFPHLLLEFYYDGLHSFLLKKSVVNVISFKPHPHSQAVILLYAEFKTNSRSPVGLYSP